MIPLIIIVRKIKMVNHRVILHISRHPKLGNGHPHGVGQSAVQPDQDVAAVVNVRADFRGRDVAAELVNIRREQDQVVVFEEAVLDQLEVFVVGGLEGQVEAFGAEAVWGGTGRRSATITSCHLRKKIRSLRSPLEIWNG